MTRTQSGAPAPKTRREQIEERSREFAQRYPDVGPLFDKFTFELIGRRYKHHSAAAVWERIRWESPAGANGRTAWKLNNNFRTHFARKFMEKYPEHKGFFRTRRLKSEDSPARLGPELAPEGDE